jgi:hypothetical protein
MYLDTKNKNKLKKSISEFLSIDNWRDVNVEDYDIVFQTNSDTTYSKCDLFSTNNMLVNNFGFHRDINVFLRKYIWVIKEITKKN